jgi:TolB-like protein
MIDMCDDGVRASDLRQDSILSRRSSEQAEDLAAGVPKISVLKPVSKDGDILVNLACSLVEDVTNGLCRQRTLSVIAPNTAWHLSLSREEVDGHRQFDIDYLVHTHVQGFRDESLLYVKVVDARTRRIIWADQYQFGRMATSVRYKDLSLQIIQTLVDQIEQVEFARFQRGRDAKDRVNGLHHR